MARLLYPLAGALTVICCLVQAAQAERLKDAEFKFSLTIPDDFARDPQLAAAQPGFLHAFRKTEPQDIGVYRGRPPKDRARDALSEDGPRTRSDHRIWTPIPPLHQQLRLRPSTAFAGSRPSRLLAWAAPAMATCPPSSVR